jgi:hypothetical protein
MEMSNEPKDQSGAQGRDHRRTLQPDAERESADYGLQGKTKAELQAIWDAHQRQTKLDRMLAEHRGTPQQRLAARHRNDVDRRFWAWESTASVKQLNAAWLLASRGQFDKEQWLADHEHEKPESPRWDPASGWLAREKWVKAHEGLDDAAEIPSGS